MPKKAPTSNRNDSSLETVKISSVVDAVDTTATNINARGFEPSKGTDDERWRKEQEVLRRAAVELAKRRAKQEVAAMSQLTTVAEKKSLETITEFLEDPSREVRNQAARALYRVNPEFAATFFNSALREGPLSPTQDDWRCVSWIRARG